jgi:hypothetical protein
VVKSGLSAKLLAPPGVRNETRRRGGLPWSIGAAAVWVVGVLVRLALGGAGTGDVSAGLMAALLGLGVWLTAMLLGRPRTAFALVLGLVVLLDLAALPPRFEPDYDSREAFYRADQVLSAHVGFDPSGVQTSPLLSLLVEPVFPASAPQPRFGLAGEVGGVSIAWSCTFRRGLQQLALPVPPAALSGRQTVDVRLHLTGSPSRESDYLLAYASANRGGFLVSLLDASALDGRATTCAIGQD